MTLRMTRLDNGSEAIDLVSSDDDDNDFMVAPPTSSSSAQKRSSVSAGECKKHSVDNDATGHDDNCC
jgi:hypothetical protein